MSARPRPVTATFPPPPLLSPIHLRPSSRSPSPLNSTASLLSVLNHNSYESVPSRVIRSDDEDVTYDAEEKSYNTYEDKHENQSGNAVEDRPVLVTRWNENPWPTNSEKNAAEESRDIKSRTVIITTNSKEQKNSKLADGPKVSFKYSPVRHSSESNLHGKNSTDDNECSVKDTKNNANELSAWEKWVVQKAKEDRTKVELELEKQKKLSEDQERIQKEKEEKKKKTKQVVREWIKDYDLRKKTETEAQVHKSQEEETQKLREKQVVSEKAKAKYSEWVHKKAEEDAKRKKEIAEKKEMELLEKQNRQKKNEEAFNNWCKKAQSRPRTAPSSYGYTDGKLRGYYDSGAYPIPSYVNPVPWQPIEIPKNKSQLKKKKNARRRQLLKNNYL